MDLIVLSFWYKNKKALGAHNPEDFVVTNTALCRL